MLDVVMRQGYYSVGPQGLSQKIDSLLDCSERKRKTRKHEVGGWSSEGVRIFGTRQGRGVGGISKVFSFCLLWEGKIRGPKE